jgi:hypothetical protein
MMLAVGRADIVRKVACGQDAAGNQERRNALEVGGAHVDPDFRQGLDGYRKMIKSPLYIAGVWKISP